MTTGFSFAILLKIKAISIRLGNQIQETVALKDQSLSLITSGADDFGAGGGEEEEEEGHMVFRGEIGRDQSSPTDLTANKKGGHKISQSPMKRSGKFYRDTIKILRSSPSPSPSPPPPPAINNDRSLNPLTPMSDQDRISPYNINTISTR